MFWRPGSILQLVLLGLFTIIAPLSAAIVYTVQTLDVLAQQNSHITQTVVSLTRASQLFQSDLLDLERRAHQYITLNEPSLFSLFVRERGNLLQQLDQIEEIFAGERLPDEGQLHAALPQIRESLHALPTTGERLNSQISLFDDLSIANARFQGNSTAYVDQLLHQHRTHAIEIKDQLLLMVSLLAASTVVFSLLFIHWISSPIKQIETEIRQLGHGDLTQKIEISGPMEMQTLGLQLEWLRSQLSDLETQKQKFLRHMSHELKTPLASLREGADLMAEGVVGALDHKQQEIIEIIRQNSRELQRLIENLLDYNQMLNIQELQVESINLTEIIDELIQSYQILLRRKDINCHCDVPQQRVNVDVGKLRTALDNLISNAVNYTPKGGEIEIRCSHTRDLLSIDVANSGQTIPESEVIKIFQPFYQGTSVRHGPIKGSGIGLSVARECATAHGGDLCLVTHQNLPVCFRITCPTRSELAA